MHPSDEPNSITVSPKLDGANFADWSRSMRRAFGTKNKLPIIDRSIQLLNLEDPNYVAWEKCYHMVHSWLIDYVSDSIAQTIMFHENSVDMGRFERNVF